MPTCLCKGASCHNDNVGSQVSKKDAKRAVARARRRQETETITCEVFNQARE